MRARFPARLSLGAVDSSTRLGTDLWRRRQIQRVEERGIALRRPRSADAGLGIRAALDAGRHRLVLHPEPQLRERVRGHRRRQFRFGNRKRLRSATASSSATPAPKPRCQCTDHGVSGAADACPGENVRLTVAASGWLADQTPAYQWMINGQAVRELTAPASACPLRTAPASRPSR